jgi:RecB family endonuclease NucS
LLIDKSNKAVIVECKQHAVTGHDIGQLRDYMDVFLKETGEMPRGILVHGGPPKLSQDVISAASKDPAVEVVSYGLDVSFRHSLISR